MLLAAITLLVFRLDGPRWLLAIAIGAQGCWLHRLYVAGHEASHRKLYLRNRRVNDWIGQLLFFPLLLPLRVHRKIHSFHHAHNRRDEHSSSLEIFPVRGEVGRWRKLGYDGLWFLAVFCGGHFFHGLISVMLFLWLPLSLARRVSPAFKGWNQADRVHSIAAFTLGLALHFGVGWLGGRDLWFVLLGAPMLVFAWVYSLLVYIYHYRTTHGPKVQFHVRRLDAGSFSRWWLLNFNEHIVHHWNPNVPWYDLPNHDRLLPPEFQSNADVKGVLEAILYQLRGVQLVDVNAHEGKQEESD